MKESGHESRFRGTNSLKRVAMTLSLIAFFFVAGMVQLSAQITVSGKVVDASNGEALPGVSIMEKGTSKGTITGMDGDFTLSVQNENSVLIFSFVGMRTQEVTVGSNKNLTVALEGSDVALNEMVVTAMGIKRDKKALGYSVQEVKGESLTEARDQNVVNSLSGKVSGLVISKAGTGSGGSSRITIRGTNSLSNNNQPLLIVDGVPIDNFVGQTSDRWGNQQIDRGSSLSDISPDDIETISVLKGPAAAALYGSRAGNGVILINTKKGNSKKGFSATFNSNTVFETASSYLKMQDEYGQGNYGKYDTVSNTSWGPKMQGQQVYTYLGTTAPFSASNNDIRDFLQTGVMSTNSLDFSTGNEKVTFFGSGSYMTSKGIIPTSEANRSTVTLRTTANLTNKLSVDVKVNYVHSNAENRPKLAQDPDNIFLNYLQMPRSIHYSDLEKYERPDGRPTRWDYTRDANGNLTNQVANGGMILNPYWSIYKNINSDSRDRVIGMANVQYKITNNLDVRVRHGIDFYYTEAKTCLGTGTPYWVNSGDLPGFNSGNLILTRDKFTEQNTEAFVTYSNNELASGKLSLTFMGGTSYMKRDAATTDARTNGLLVKDFFSLQVAKGLTGSNFETELATSSVFGTASVGYNSWLFLDLTARNDWSSTLKKGEWSYFYPSFGLGWVVTDMLSSMGTTLPSFISFAKLRASYAQVGNATDPYAIQLTYGIPQFGNGISGATTPGTLPNANLKPENIKSTEFGADLRFLNNRVGIDFTYFKKNATNQIIRLDVPASTGYTQKLINAGNIENKGIELLVNVTPVKLSNGLQWDLTFNYSKISNKIVELSPETKIQSLGGSGNQVQVVAREGNAYGDILGSTYRRDANGNIIVDANGLPLSNATATKIGNYLPDWTGGVLSALSFKGISFNFLVDMRKGGNIYAGSMSAAASSGTWEKTAQNREGGLLVKGVKEDGSANTTTTDAQTYWNKVSSINEEWIRDASFVRLREVSLGYAIPSKVFGNSPVKSVKLSIVGRNLWLIKSDLDGLDPESSYTGGSNVQGLELGSTPNTRTIGFNINIGF